MVALREENLAALLDVGAVELLVAMKVAFEAVSKVEHLDSEKVLLLVDLMATILAA